MTIEETTSTRISSEDESHAPYERFAAAVVQEYGYLLMRWNDGSGYHLDEHASHVVLTTWPTLDDLADDWKAVSLSMFSVTRPCPGCTCEHEVDRNADGEFVALWQGDCDECQRRPESYMDWVDQTSGPYTTRMEIQTDGEVHLEAGWDDWTEEERDEADAWTERLHDARVEIAQLDDEDRAWLADYIEHDDDGDPDVLEGALEALEKAARPTAASVKQATEDAFLRRLKPEEREGARALFRQSVKVGHPIAITPNLGGVTDRGSE